MQNGKDTTSVVEVIPIVRGMVKSTLSYFTTKKVAAGDFVKVPVRNGSATAIVEKVERAGNAKTDIKRRTFALKKLESLPGTNKKEGAGVPKVPEVFLAAARKAAAYYATSLGSILAAVLPKMLLERPELVFGDKPRVSKRMPSDPRNEPLLIQMEYDERMSQYKSIIRESLAKKNSVMFIVPTEEGARRAFETLSYGIEEYAYLFILSRPTKELGHMLKEARNEKKSILFVATPAGIAFDRQDLETIIVERENSAAYRTLSRPYIHIRIFLEYLAAESKKRLILGDSVLGVETLWKEKNGDYRELVPLKWRLNTEANSSLVDMKSESRPLPLGEDGFEIISPELKSLIAEALDEESSVFLFGARKGLSPTTVCGDCGSVLTCKNCGAPVVLHLEGDQRIYVCHACRARRSAETRCDICSSWKLSALGIGVDRIAQTIRRLFPEAKIWILDKDHTPTAPQARKIIKQFKEGGGVLIGTELALLFIDKVPYAGLVSADSLFSIPDFSIHERIFYLVNRVREIGQKGVVIQTRNIGKKILAWASSGNVLEFYKDEIAEREELSYPPFSLFVKVVFQKNEAGVESKREYLKQVFGKWRPEFVEGKTSTAMILRIERQRWPVEELTVALSLLSPDFLIKVDPESILV